MKRPGTHFMINLVLVDIFKATFNLPMTIVSSYHESWIFDQIGKNKYLKLIR